MNDMSVLNPIMELTGLMDEHGDTLTTCKGCELCDRISKFKSILVPDPKQKYKHILDKGQDMTKSDIEYLLKKDVPKKHIIKALKMGSLTFFEMAERWGIYKINRREVERVMGKFKLTQEEYNDHKALGKTDEDIAKVAGVSTATLNYHKKKWSKAEVKPRTPKLILEENESSPSIQEDLVSDLSKKLRKAEAANERQTDEIARLEVELGEVRKENQDKDIENTLLRQTIDNLKKEIQDLHNAAEDTEKEVAASHEYMEREQQLMIDADVWKQKALQYEAEYKRQTDTLKEERTEKERYKGEALAFRLALKAVL